MNFEELIESIENLKREYRKNTWKGLCGCPVCEKERENYKDPEKCGCNFCEEEKEKVVEFPVDIDKDEFEEKINQTPFWVEFPEDYKKWAKSLIAENISIKACLDKIQTWHPLTENRMYHLRKLQEVHLDLFYEIMQRNKESN